jgi:hypothetical protein
MPATVLAFVLLGRRAPSRREAGRGAPPEIALASLHSVYLVARATRADDSVLANGGVRLGVMGEGGRSPLNLNALLAAVEAAPPVAAVDVLAEALAEAVGAREVSFLIADFSGRSLIRLGHSGGKGALRL